MDNIREISPVGYIYNDFKEKFGIPRQSGKAPAVISKIVFLPEFSKAEAFRELDGFSHIWLLFGFSKAEYTGSLTVRPPRLGGNKRVGVFACRSPFRPNGLGISAVKLLSVGYDKKDGAFLLVSGADLLDKTPIYDVKPYLPYCDSIADAKGGYTEETRSYRLKVIIPDELSSVIPPEMLEPIRECLAEDPRPSYQNDPERIYGMSFAELDIRFTVENGVLTVKNIIR